MTQEVLERLKKLQDVLSQKFSLEKELKEIPKSLHTKTEAVSRLKKTYIDRNQQYEVGKQKIAELKQNIEQAEKDREESEGLIVEISTQREYEALLKQIKEATEREQQFRRDLQKEEKSFEEMTAVLLRDEATISQQEDELKEEQAKITNELEQRQKTLNLLVDEERELTEDQLLNKEILFKFERIITKKEGRGIVPLRKGVCTGCNMILPLQFVNEVRSNSGDQPHFCPYCSMILYHEDSDDGYLNFVYDENMGLRSDEEDEDFVDEELDEDRLMEAEMNEGYDDDDEAESDELLEDEESGLIDEDEAEAEDEEEDDDEDIEESVIVDDDLVDPVEDDLEEGEDEVPEDEEE